MRQVQGLLLILICTTATAAVKGGEATIKMLGVGSPIVGSQSTFGRVVLAAPAAQRVVITLVSSNTRIATAPADVIINVGGTDQTFVVKTEPVVAPTTLTLTARTPGSPDATATFTVMPPALAILDCEPKSVPGGTHVTCKAWMDGLVANGATPQIALSTSSAQIASPAQPNVTVRAGSRSVTFDVIAADLPQSATATISAVYAGVTKSSNITVTPAAIKDFGCVVVPASPENVNGLAQCSVVGGDYYYGPDPSYAEGRYVGFAVRITALAPQSGYKIPLTFTLAAPPNANGQEPPSNPFDIGMTKTLEVPAGKDHAFYRFHTEPTASTYVMKVTARDPITHNSYDTELTVNPPALRSVFLPPETAVPLGGVEADVYAYFRTEPPPNGIAYDVTYSGTTDIKGPARVRIKDPNSTHSFKVKIFPCALNPPCHVSVTLGGVTATATVKP